MSTCRGCGAEIVWATTVNGKAIPLDAKPERRSVFVSPDDPQILARQTDEEDDPRVRVVSTFMPHHATCPKVEEFRR